MSRNLKIKKEILETLDERIMLCDGAMGSTLHKLGYKAIVDLLNLDCKAFEDIVQIHLDYINSGSEIIQTNTLGSSRLKLKRSGHEKDINPINKNAVSAVRKAIDLYYNNKQHPIKRIYVAGNIGPSGELLEPFGNVKKSEMVKSFFDQIKVLIENNVDLILIETMIDLNEAIAAVEAVRKIDSDILVACTLSFTETGITVMGNKAEEYGKTLIEAGSDIIGANCSVGSKSMIEITKKIRDANPDARLLIQPNAGMPKLVDGETIFDETPEIMAENFKEIISYRPNIIGGCCGSTPEHIKKIASLIHS